MRKSLFTIASLMFITQSYATPIYHPAGPNLTYGAISNGQTIISDITNPAAGASVFTKDTGQFRMGVLSSIGGGYEIGDVANLVTEVDNTIDTFTNPLTDTDPRIPAIDNTLTLQQNIDNVLAAVNTIVSDTNNLMSALQTDGYFKAFFSGHVPLMPIVITSKSLNGSFVVDINASVVGLAEFLSDPLNPFVQSDIDAAVTTAFAGGSPVSLGDLFSSDSAVIVKGATMTEISLGYSRSIMKETGGELFAGLRGNYFDIAFTRTAQRIDSSANQDLNTIFDNNSDSAETDSSGLGIDLGLLWVSEHYRAGATLKNINKPSFDFGAIDTTGFTDPLILTELQATNTYEMDPHLRLEGAIFSASQNWVFGVGLDANAIEDAVGQEYQWASASAAYATDSWIIPGIRLGYRSNLAGTELSYTTVGLTLFKSFNLDFALANEKINIEANDLTSQDGNIERSMIVNLGFELTF